MGRTKGQGAKSISDIGGESIMEIDFPGFLNVPLHPSAPTPFVNYKGKKLVKTPGFGSDRLHIYRK